MTPVEPTTTAERLVELGLAGRDHRLDRDPLLGAQRGGRPAAKTKLEGQGESAGVLFSSDFPDLRPGYWVVFSGSYPSRSAAIAQATKLRPQFPGAYAREITG